MANLGIVLAADPNDYGAPGSPERTKLGPIIHNWSYDWESRGMPLAAECLRKKAQTF
jgi:hypothetical protein